MGLLDKLKKKKKTVSEEEIGKEKKKVKKEDEKEVKYEQVVTPDGRLISKPKKVAKEKKLKPKKEDTKDAYRVLIRPLITEKASSLSVYNQYAFEVAKNTNKIEVRKAIKAVYGVTPIKVNMINIEGKNVRYGRTEGRTKDWKKAIITLPPGSKINIQEGL